MDSIDINKVVWNITKSYLENDLRKKRLLKPTGGVCRDLNVVRCHKPMICVN